ncbi:MAG: GreA/GreB family elongation factor [Candidatus Magasanikbacteria bacterium]|nr:GreA/GreB family elongation factor [Candidatus Magasanikbacteria bacterium]
MRVPIRKPGIYTHLKPDPFITRERFDELSRKLERLKKVTRPPAMEEVKRLSLTGDYSENHAYQHAKGRLRGINQRILDIEYELTRAQIIDMSKHGKTVVLGSIVTVVTGGKAKIYQILGSTQTDPTKGVISHNSPLGVALMGRSAGEEVEVKLKDKTVKYKITKIE